MTEEQVLSKLKSVGAIVENSHFVYSSGLHGDCYVNKDALYPHTQLTSELTNAMIQAFSKDKIDVVLAPAMGGIILSQWAAFHLSKLFWQRFLSKVMVANEYVNPNNCGKMPEFWININFLPKFPFY